VAFKGANRAEDKSRFEQAFGMLHSLTCLRSSGTPDEMLRDVDDAIKDFKTTFSDENQSLRISKGIGRKSKV
jgi:hypothetical protein